MAQTITVADFSRITGISRHTIYAWIYRESLPKGISLLPAGKAKIFRVTKSSEYYNLIKGSMEEIAA